MSVNQQDRDQNAAESGWQPQPQPPVQPKKRHRVRNTFLVLVGLFAVIMTAVIISAGMSVDTTTSTGSTGSTSEGPLTNSSNKEHPPAQDVRLGKFSNDSIGWTQNIRVTNHSSRTSDYMITIEVVDSQSGVRVDESATLLSDVKPNQKVADQMVGMTDVSDHDVQVKVVRVERIASS